MVDRQRGVCNAFVKARAYHDRARGVDKRRFLRIRRLDAQLALGDGEARIPLRGRRAVRVETKFVRNIVVPQSAGDRADSARQIIAIFNLKRQLGRTAFDDRAGFKFQALEGRGRLALENKRIRRGRRRKRHVLVENEFRAVRRADLKRVALHRDAVQRIRPGAEGRLRLHFGRPALERKAEGTFGARPGKDKTPRPRLVKAALA